jgi:RimJ/RimL family protein N-acetyltransferase
MLGPVLEGDRVRLAPPRPENLETFVRWFADPEVTRYLSRRYPPSPKQEDDWLEGMASSGEDVAWAISLKETGALIGVTGLHKIDWRYRHGWIEISLGDRSAWAHGYATETIRLGTAYAFQELGFEKVLASVYGCNGASVRLLAKVGYRECGVLRRNAFFAGQWHDEWLAEILREEWKGRQVSMPPRTACRPPTA